MRNEDVTLIKETIINQENWDRKVHFDFFSGEGAPLYDVTTSFDVTHYYDYVKEHQLSFYYGLIYATVKIMNNIENFRYKIRGEDVILMERLIPSFTDLKPESELFHIVTLDLLPDESISEFCQRAKEKSHQQADYFPKVDFPKDALVHISSLPWFSFSTISNEIHLDKEDSVPKVSWGKYEKKDGRLFLGYSLEVNHRLIDGIHIGKFVNQLQKYLDNL